MNELTPDEHRILVDAIHDSATVVHKGRMLNERIEQLLEQARAECFQFGSKPATTVGYDELEKFAQLIVKECMRMCEVAQVGYLTHGLEKEASGAYSVKQYIEEYLGVES